MILLVSGSVALVKERAAAGAMLGHIVTPPATNLNLAVASGLPWAADNGCFHGLNTVAFRKMLARIRELPRCLWVVCPDQVANAQQTRRLFDEWSTECRATGHPVAFVGQDGAEDGDIPWSDFDCWFVGGTTAWKLSYCSQDLIAEARQRGKWVHMGRVNTRRRLTLAHDAGCDSVDGSIFSKMSDKFMDAGCRWLRNIHRQPLLFGDRS